MRKLIATVTVVAATVTPIVVSLASAADHVRPLAGHRFP